MPEAAASTTTVAAWAAWVSSVVLALLGVDYYALIGAFGGVLFTVSAVKATSWIRLVSAVAITTFVAAVLGQGIAEWAGLGNRKVVLALCLVLGGIGQVGLLRLLQVAGDSLTAWIEKRGAQ